MGFVLSVLYLATYYLSPPVLFGPLAPFRIELILAAILVFVSIPALIRSFILKTPQSFALVGLAFSVFLSVLIGMRWPGGAVKAFLEFIPNAFAFFLVCLHCNTKKKLSVLVLLLFSVCLFVIARGSIDLLRGASPSNILQPDSSENAILGVWNVEHPYLFPMRSDAGEWFFRLRGQGQINDPNDFGQLIVCSIPLMFIFWRSKKALQNIALVILPVCTLLVGTFLTHSRGALLALVAMATVAAWRRIGKVPALLVAGALFIAAMALQFTGGREISASAGSDRTALWGSGMEMLKSHPLFGVGFNDFADYAGNTAHNSVMVCAAELGLFGLFFWCLFLFPTVRDVLKMASPTEVGEAIPVPHEETPFSHPAVKVDDMDQVEINRLGRLLLYSLTGFLVAAMFLSRAFVLTFFLLGGMVEVVYQLALVHGMIAPRLKIMNVLPRAGGLAIALLTLMYVVVRVLNLSR